MSGRLGRIWPLLVIVFVALGLRAEGLHSVSLCHYDEGVYVSNALRLAGGSNEGFAFSQALHAPPLYPLLAACVFRWIAIPWPNLALYVNVLFGVATVVLVYVLAKQICSSRVAIIAALLLAASDYHIALSRMALTDVSFAFWLTVGLWAFLRAEQLPTPACSRLRWSWLLLAGMFTGCAWNTKYHGWLTIVIMGIYTVVANTRASSRESVADNRERGLHYRWRSFFANVGKRLLPCFAVMAIAILCFLPWLIYVETYVEGGYRRVVEVHRSYLGSLRDWPTHASVVLASLPAFRHYGWILLINLAVVSLAVLRGWRRLVFGCLVATAIPLGVDAVLLALGVCAAIRVLRCGPAGAALPAVWLVLFCVLTPFYTPFIRLFLPAWPAVAVLAATTIEPLFTASTHGAHAFKLFHHSPLSGPQRRFFSVAETVAFGILVAWMLYSQPFGLLPSQGVWQRWQSRHAYRSFAEWVADSTPRDAAFLCQGQPPFSIYCPRQAVVLGNEPFSAATEGLPLTRPTYFALDFRVVHEPQTTAREDIIRHTMALERIANIALDANIVVLLDYLPPEKVAKKVAEPKSVISYVEDSFGNRLPIPPPIEEAGMDVIMIYRVHLDRLQAGSESKALQKIR